MTGLAKSKDIKIYPVLFGSCSPITPGFLQAASETGGQVFFLFGEEAGAVTQLADLVGRNNAVQILSVQDQFPIHKTRSVPVDISLTRSPSPRQARPIAACSRWRANGGMAIRWRAAG
ncbi:hypothetical protein [Rugamonas apoptosis]|uniref:hypothetical protein n=1 Tax=Rugamonas apoptosis TaxID=2758570 RepID=UPI001E5D2B32|nr:hypothetical protein [Rugamonas apoptosis]